MRRWALARNLGFISLRGQRPRLFSVSVNSIERVSVRCGLSGSITIDLHNIAENSSADHLLVYLPPYSTTFTDKPVELPRFFERRPTAVVNYRWAGFTPFQVGDVSAPEPNRQPEEDEYSHLRWPAPIQDAARAYYWIAENLIPSHGMRRRVYVYGSYLGASLATSLALTETKPDEQTAIQGCIAYNGIYNWTMFLPGYHKGQKGKKITQSADPEFLKLKQRIKALFEKPDNLFDPFASPCLFFHSPGLFVPPSFYTSGFSLESFPAARSLPPKTLAEILKKLKPPQEGRLIYPPRDSELEIPETLLLSTVPQPPPSHRKGQRGRMRHFENNFETQAKELAKLMQHSVDRIEEESAAKKNGVVHPAEEIPTRDDVEGSTEEIPGRKVQIHGVEFGSGNFKLSREAEDLAAAWLQERIAGNYAD
ncbi:hypothetical protein AAE478_007744 [Parahypoxylon ruwenzoriense]